MKVRLAAAALAAAFVALPALARADVLSPLSVGVHAGTLGYGISLERPLLFDLSARLETGTMTSSDSVAYGGQSFARLRHFNNVLAVLDWRPAGYRFRVSAGLLFGGDRTDYVARDDLGEYLINGNPYPVAAAGRVAGRVTFDRPALYLGTGIGGGILPGLTISANAGVVFLNGISSIAASGPAAATPALQADLRALAGQFPTHVAKPVVSVGLVYRP